MLDVDGQVISAEVLVQRVEQLLATIDTEGTPAETVGPMGAPSIDSPIHTMRIIQREMHPPDLVRGRGLRGRAGHFMKRLVRKLTSWYVEPRWEMQHDLNNQVIDFASLVYNFVHNGTQRIDNELDELRRQNARLRLQLVDSSERVIRYRQALSALNDSASRHGTLLEGVAMKDEVRPLVKEIGSILNRLGAAGSSGANINYVEFEDRFRGGDEGLEQAQKRYLSLFPPPSISGRIIDIGCGRGEMLTMLKAEGHEVLGVDLDSGMIDVCTSKGLDAIEDDGIHFLSQVHDDSLKGVFCAQVVEHLITPEMEQLIRLAFRSLQSGGVLIIETINPRSSFALGNHFYADTTHVRPVHPETLRFICEQIGFSSVQLEERSPHPSLDLIADMPDGSVGQAVEALLENVFGYQDYVIVATK